MELIFSVLIGSLVMILGLFIWLKQKVTLIHSYHYKKVKDSDIKPYTKQMGIGVASLGIGIMGSGFLINLVKPSLGLIFMGLSFVIGFTIIVKAQNRYNGGLF